MILKYKGTEGEWVMYDGFSNIAWQEAEVYWEETQTGGVIWVEKNGNRVYPDVLQYIFANIYANPGQRYTCYWIRIRDKNNDPIHIVVGQAFVMNDNGKTIEYIG